MNALIETQPTTKAGMKAAMRYFIGCDEPHRFVVEFLSTLIASPLLNDEVQS